MHTLRIYPDADSLTQAAAETVLEAYRAAVAERTLFTLALSGGSTPRALYQRLAAPDYARLIDWSRVYVFWGDERAVPPDHADSNYRMTRLALLDYVPLPTANIHRIEGEREPAQAAAVYEDALRQFFALRGGAARFDLVLLGMGDDGHTASLFPGTAALAETQRWVVANSVPALNTTRITLTFPVINAARQVVFLVAGAGKADMLRRVLEDQNAPPLPAQQIQPQDGTLVWLVDQAAASHLERRQ